MQNACVGTDGTAVSVWCPCFPQTCKDSSLSLRLVVPALSWSIITAAEACVGPATKAALTVIVVTSSPVTIVMKVGTSCLRMAS